MVTFEDPAVLGDFMNAQLEQPMQYKLDSVGRPVYRCQTEFGPLRTVRNILPKIVDFGMSATLDCDDGRGIHPIQPDHIAPQRSSLAVGGT